MTTRLPRALHLFTTSRRESFCTSIAVQKTTSAHSMCESFRRRTFRSTSRRFHARGKSAETVRRPSGGKAERRPSKGSAWRKLQYVSGYSGLMSRIFIEFSSCRGLNLHLTLARSPGPEVSNRRQEEGVRGNSVPMSRSGLFGGSISPTCDSAHVNRHLTPRGIMKWPPVTTRAGGAGRKHFMNSLSDGAAASDVEVSKAAPS